MSRLSNFLGKATELELGEHKFNVYPLKVKDSSLLNIDKNATIELQMKSMYELIRSSLRDEKDITDAELDNLPLEVFKLLMDTISKVNGLQSDESEAIRRLKEAGSK